MNIKARGGFRNKLYKNRYVILAAVILAAILIGVIYMFTRPQDQTSAVPKKVVNAQKPLADEELKKEGLVLKAEIKVSPFDKNTDMLKVGDHIRVTIKLENNSSQQSRFLMIKTGLKSANFYDMRNYQGLTGISTQAGEVEIKNVVMNPGQSQELIFEANLNNPDSDEIKLQPSITDTTNKTVVTGKSVTYKVIKSSEQGTPRGVYE